jgi:hypothetical protein
MIIGSIAAIINGITIPLAAYVSCRIYGNFVIQDADVLV